MSGPPVAAQRLQGIGGQQRLLDFFQRRKITRGQGLADSSLGILRRAHAQAALGTRRHQHQAQIAQAIRICSIGLGDSHGGLSLRHSRLGLAQLGRPVARNPVQVVHFSGRSCPRQLRTALFPQGKLLVQHR